MKFSTLVLVFVKFISGESGKVYSKDGFDTITQAIYAPFSSYRMKSFEYGDDTIINHNQHVRLTPDRINARGYLWSKETLPKDKWQVEFEFKVFSKDQQANGDGFAFWATESRMEKGPVYGNQDNFKGLGILFDNYAKSGTSKKSHQLYGIFGNGETHYNIRDHSSNNNIGDCYIHHRSDSSSSPLKARVTYVKQKFLEVDLQMRPDAEWSRCFVAQGITLPDELYMGFTAQNRDSHDNHDIISVQAKTGKNIEFNSYMEHVDSVVELYNSNPILSKIFYMICIVLVLCYIYRQMKLRKELKKKRF